MWCLCLSTKSWCRCPPLVDRFVSVGHQIYEALRMAININSPGFVDKQQGRADEEGQGRVERRTASLFKAILFLEPEQAISLCWCLFIACLSTKERIQSLRAYQIFALLRKSRSEKNNCLGTHSLSS